MHRDFMEELEEVEHDHLIVRRKSRDQLLAERSKRFIILFDAFQHCQIVLVVVIRYERIGTLTKVEFEAC